MKDFFKKIHGLWWYLFTFKIPWYVMFMKLDAIREYAPDYYRGKRDALEAITNYATSGDWGTYRHFCYRIMDMHYADCQMSGGLDFNNWLGSWEDEKELTPMKPPKMILSEIFLLALAVLALCAVTWWATTL